MGMEFPKPGTRTQKSQKINGSPGSILPPGPAKKQTFHSQSIKINLAFWADNSGYLSKLNKAKSRIKAGSASPQIQPTSGFPFYPGRTIRKPPPKQLTGLSRV
jgi:hypothetical protein